MKNTVNFGVILILILFSIIAGKFVRYNFMYSNLVDVSIGWSMLGKIQNEDLDFGLVLHGETTDDASSASDNSSKIFQVLNYMGLENYYEFEIFISVIWNLILIIILFLCRKEYYTVKDTIFLCVSFAVLNIFDFCLSKEPIQMLYFLLLFAVIISKLDNKKKIILSLLVIGLSVITFRLYYILIIVFGIAIFAFFEFYVLKTEKIKAIHIILAFVFIAFVYFMLLNVSQLANISSYGELVRVRLRTSIAVSDIRAWIGSSNHFLLSIDYLIIIFRLLFPFELLLIDVKYIPYFLYQIYISVLLILNIKNIKNITFNQKLSTYILLAFIFTSATFEPDFGSWIRHEAVTFPIMLIAFDVLNKNIE